MAGALTARAGGFFRAGRHRLCTQLAKAVSPIERDSVTGWKRAPGDRKTFALKVTAAISFLFLTPAWLASGANSLLRRGAKPFEMQPEASQPAGSSPDKHTNVPHFERKGECAASAGNQIVK